MRPPSAILDRLASFRLLAGGDDLSTRQGERRSNARGVGMEFAGYRPYREGDDLRRLDSRLFVRYRRPYMREQLADRQLRVAVLVDTSPSMEFGTPTKRSIATMLAALLGYAALSSGDLVEIGLPRGGRINWSDAMQGSSRAETLFRWLDAADAIDPMPFASQLRLALPRLKQASLTILISDWWLDDPDRDLAPLGELAGTIVALQLVAPEEENPLLLGRGPVRLRDIEGDSQLDLAIDPASAADYTRLLADYRQDLSVRLRRLGSRLLTLRSDMPPAALFTELVRGRLLGQIGESRGD